MKEVYITSWSIKIFSTSKNWISDQFFLVPVQATELQSRESLFLPWHSRPPLRGKGLLHLLVRTFLPPSQLAEHCETPVQEPQPPSTNNNKWSCEDIWDMAIISWNFFYSNQVKNTSCFFASFSWKLRGATTYGPTTTIDTITAIQALKSRSFAH